MRLTKILVIGLGGVLIAFGAGCTSGGEVRLWPLLDVERPKPDGGAHVELLWPIVEVDATEAKKSYAVRPLIAYDGKAEAGSFLWPFGTFGWLPRPHLGLYPLYSWRQWQQETQSGGHFFLPAGGYWHDADRKRWTWGPGLYYRERATDDPSDKVDATLIPPLFYARDEDHSSFLLANYYQYEAPRAAGYVLFPFVWWQEWGDRELAAADSRRTRNRALFPVFGWEQEVSREGVRSTRTDVLWPLSTFESGPEAEWSQLLVYMISWRYRDGELSYLNLLPIYSRGPKHFAVPIVGFCQWDSSQDEAASDERRVRKGWALWPWLSHRREYDAADPEILLRERWVNLAGFLRTENRPEEGFRRVDPLFPLISHESSPERRAHRFWPLYRYKKNDQGTNFRALAELIATHHGTEISEGPHVVLRPFTYQSTADGDHRLRLFWKFFESSRRGDDRRWGLHPLLYSQESPDRGSFLFLGGLVGQVREEGERKLRLFWVLDV